jgi:preprotein translocase subunit SecE
MNNQRIVDGAFGALGVVGGYFVRQVADTLWGILRLPLPQEWPVSPSDLMGIASAVAIFIIFRKNAKANTFTNEVLVELSKVTWPPRKETLLSTVVVTIMVAICSLILFGFDTLWGTLVKVLYG